MRASTRSTGAERRVAAVDAARSAALLGMAAFHFVFDLQFLGVLPSGTVQSGPWPGVARSVAASFLFLSGVSFWLAHGEGMRWRPFWRRLAVLVLSAGLVSAVTFAVLPGAFVYFGILHSIAAASLLGPVLLRLPVMGLLGLALGVLAVAGTAQLDAFNHPALWWTGLATAPRPSVDFEPLFPWAAAFIAGLAVGKALDRRGLWPRIARWQPPVAWLLWPGRNSLAVYLLHQPVLMAAIWTMVALGRTVMP